MRVAFALVLFGPATSTSPAVEAPSASESAASEPAGPQSADAEPAPAEAPEIVRARELYDEGRVKFEVGDYDGAIELWTESYAAVARRKDADQILAAVSYNLALAQQKAYEVDRDIRRLRKAVQMLDQSLKLYVVLGSEDLAQMQQQRADFGAQLDEAEAQEGQNDDPGPAQDAGQEQAPRRGGLLIGGAVSLGLGVGALAVMGYGLARGSSLSDGFDDPELSVSDRRTQLKQGYTANTLAIVGGVSGGVLVAAGATLVVLGLRPLARKGDTARVRLAPGPGDIGVGLGGSF